MRMGRSGRRGRKRLLWFRADGINLHAKMGLRFSSLMSGVNSRFVPGQPEYEYFVTIFGLLEQAAEVYLRIQWELSNA